LADTLLPHGEDRDWWNLKKGREDISAYWDCIDLYHRVFSYHRVFEKRENRC
jgi:hypothetical protein